MIDVQILNEQEQRVDVDSFAVIAGRDGKSAHARVEAIDGGAEIICSDENGETRVEIHDGKNGESADVEGALKAAESAILAANDAARAGVVASNAAADAKKAAEDAAQSAKTAQNATDAANKAAGVAEEAGKKALENANSAVTATENANKVAENMKERADSGEFDGAPGARGDDGVSPEISVEDIDGGHKVTVTDANGTKTFDVMNGAKGDPGTTDYNNLENKPEIPSKVSELQNDSEFISSKPLGSRTYTNVWNTSPTPSASQSQQYCGWFMFKVKPLDKNSAFRIKYRLKAWMPNWTKENLEANNMNPSSYGGGGEAKGYGACTATVELTYFPGDNKTHTSYSIDAAVFDSGFRSLYYTNLAYPKVFSEDSYYYFGVSIYSSYAYYTTSTSMFNSMKEVFNRTIVIEVLELDNAEFEWLEEELPYTASSLPDNTLLQLGITANGYTHTGDANQVDRGGGTFYKKSDGAVTAYAMLMYTDNGIGQIMNNTANNTAITKQFSDRRFDIWKGLRLYNSGTVRANGFAFGGTVLYSYFPTFDSRYSFNCGNVVLSAQIGVDVYMVGTFDDDGYFVPSQIDRVNGSTKFKDCLADETMIDDVPDGSALVLIGHTSTTNRYTITFEMKHPIYKKNGAKLEYIGSC